MAFTFGIAELVDMLIMTAAAGYIFMDAFRMPASADPVDSWKNQKSWSKRFWYSAALVAPAIILHELGHKFVALFYGLTATFEAAYTWLGIGVLIKLLNFPFLFMVPAYVRIIGQATPLEHSLIAFAGPAINLVIFVAAWIVLKTATLENKWIVFWQYVKYINGFLFIFNMIPIPGFDGSKVFASLGALF